ncbi:MAG: glutamate--tRNA ligase [Thermoguttaceae bacterium]
MTVRTRFAPSPTGYLHIGGVRTALFCWLFSRHHRGQFILRIDDTDQQRNVDAALRPILNGLRWLGIDWDEGPDVGGPCAPYYQSQRADRHGAAVEKLVAAGKAYRDYARTDEIQAEREAAEKAKTQFVYSRRWMAETQQDCVRWEAEGRQAVVRLKMPREGKLVIPDLVRGDVEFDWAREQDHVIQRTDGSCLYHLASVVDDHDMEISHVIRAEEHLSNTPRQIFIAQSLGYRLPQYAHLPFVAEPGSKVKLSKRKLDKYLKNKDFAQLVRHGQKIAEAIGMTVDMDTFNPVIVDFYEQVGYLPEAIVNYLALLGWSLDDKTEQFSRDDLVAAFSLERVNKAPASFDPKKLSSFQERHMLALPTDTKVELVLPYAEKAGMASAADGIARAKVRQIVEAAADRIKVAGDIVDYGDFFVADDALGYDESAFDKRIRKADGAPELLAKFREALAGAEAFDAQSLDGLLHAFVEAQGIEVGQVIHAIRVAATGKAVGFGLFDTLAILGKESCVARIDRALGMV